MTISMFCMPGRHSGPVCEEGPEGLVPPRSWRAVSASIDRETDEWRYDPDSGCMIYVCPLHTVKGEPTCN